MARFTLTIRRTGAATRTHFDSAQETLTALAAAAEELARTERRDQTRVFAREYEPVMQVAARLEVSGPGVRGGVDIRGDGSSEAYSGRWRKRLVEQQPGEDAVQALRRVLEGSAEGL